MMVKGSDHDMLIMADVMRLLGNQKASFAAYTISKYAEINTQPLGLAEAVDLLLTWEEPAIGLVGDHDVLLDIAKSYAAIGCPTMLRVCDRALGGVRLWHLVVDPVRNMVGTLHHAPDPEPPTFAGTIQENFVGELLLVAKIAPGWTGRWDRLIRGCNPLQ